MSEVKGTIKSFNAIRGKESDWAAYAVGGGPLSGYLAGRKRGGLWVRALEDAWAERFGVKHAVATNSATSGLLAASAAVGLGPSDSFACSPMTMSATVAAPALLGAMPEFVDVYDRDFCFGWGHSWRFPGVKALIVTNLFGHPAELAYLRRLCELMNGRGYYMIEDNAQSPFAMENSRYAGTIGHIGIFSCNVHKHLQCGEGGMCVTDDDELAERMRAFINHGEHVSDRIGLNLRMPEVCAAIMCAQLERADEIIGGRVAQAEAIIKAIGEIPGILPPVVREGCTHVYYTIPFLIERNRAEFCAALRAEGVPIVEGYQEPLYRMPAFKRFARPCPVAEDLQDRRLFYFENCAWSPTPEQIGQIGAAFRKVAEKIQCK